VIDDSQVCMRVVLVRLHNLCPSASHGTWLPICTLEPRSHESVALDHTTALFFLGTFFEEYLAEDVFFLAERVIILHIVVVGLVKHAI